MLKSAKVITYQLVRLTIHKMLRVTKKILNKFRHGKIILIIFFFSVIFAGVALKLEKVGPTKSSCFDLFIHWLINQITLTDTIFQGHTKIDLSIS